jgi:Domain of unknown function (DUF305)
MQRQEILYLLLGIALGTIFASLLFLRAPIASERAYELGIREKSESGESKKSSSDHMTMEGMTDALKDKQGDDFDKAFIDLMIEHHQGAVDMAELALSQAGHEEIKTLSRNIILAQKKEIEEMQSWYKAWGFGGMMPNMMHEEGMRH